MTTKRLILAMVLLGALAGAAVHASAEKAPMDSKFLALLRRGETAGIREALSQGASPNNRDASGNTALMLAAAYGPLDSLQVLLEHDADVNATNQAGATSLMRAATDPDKVALLLAHKADVHLRSELGNTALILAARPMNSHRAVGLLLASGADVNATNNWGATALMAAAAGGDVQTVKLLLQHGADVNAQPALSHVAFIFGGGRSALMWAAYRGDLEVLKLLIAAGADVNAPGLMGTPLSQAVWADRTPAARLLIEHGAKVNQPGPMDGYTALHWAASTEQSDPSLVKMLLAHGADPNAGGGENVDAFMGTLQTPLMLAQRRGQTPVLAALVAGGAHKATPDRVPNIKPAQRTVPERVDDEVLRAAISRAVAPLQKTALASKQSFLKHASKQDCISCHQQLLPMAATALAKKNQVEIDVQAQEQLVKMVSVGELQNPEVDWEALFHPEPAHTKGYALLAMDAEGVPADETTDAWVHHLASIQGKDGQWFNNLPRPPLQTSDVGATALAVFALQHYPLPGQKAALAHQISRARDWLWQVQPHNTEERAYQILGLSWAGESAGQLKALAESLVAEQRADGGWAQLPATQSDAYATGQVIYALRVGAGFGRTRLPIERALRFLLTSQLEDGTWHVRRRAFPFQPTMDSGFPHGRDSWISATATSWAVMALSLPEEPKAVALRR